MEKTITIKGTEEEILRTLDGLTLTDIEYIEQESQDAQELNEAFEVTE